jgi:hypothetical protein
MLIINSWNLNMYWWKFYLYMYETIAYFDNIFKLMHIYVLFKKRFL